MICDSMINKRRNIALIVLFLMFVGCHNVSNKEEITECSTSFSTSDVISNKRDTSMVVNSSRALIDTTITVSFKGLVLGSSVNQYIGKIIPASSKVEDLDSYSKYIFKTNLTVHRTKLTTEVNVYCINDTISLIIAYVIPDREDRHIFQDLKEMFVSKYGKECSNCSLSSFSKQYIRINGDNESNNHFGHVYIWDFNSTNISLIEVNHNWQRENYEIDSYGRIVYTGLVTETTYGEKFIMIYSQKQSFPVLLQETYKWNEYSRRQFYHEYSIELERQRIQDSIEIAKKRSKLKYDATQI